MKKILIVYGGKFHPYKEAVEIFKLSKQYNCPVFSSSSLRFDYNIQKVKAENKSNKEPETNIAVNKNTSVTARKTG